MRSRAEGRRRRPLCGLALRLVLGIAVGCAGAYFLQN